MSEGTSAAADRLAASRERTTAHEAAYSTRPVILAILAAVFMVAAEARVIAPLLPAIASDFRTTAARAGMLITAYTVPYGLFQIVYGPLADRFSRQRVMGAALALFALGTLASGFAPSLLALDLLRLAAGAAAAGVIPVALAFVGDAVPYAERQAALGRVVSVSALGGVLSAALGGVTASFLGWRAIFVVYGLAGFGVAWLLIRIPVVRSRSGPRLREGLLEPYRAVFRYAGRRAMALYVLVFVEGLTATSTLGYLGALLFERDGLNYATIGALLTINGVASLLTGRRVGVLVRRLGERGMLVAGGMLMSLAYLVAAFQPALLFFPLAMLLSGCGFVVAHSTLQTRATELVPARRGTAMALFAFSLFVGGGLGTFLAGAAIDYYGFGVTLISTAVSLIGFTLLAAPLMQVVQRPIPAAGDDAPVPV